MSRGHWTWAGAASIALLIGLVGLTVPLPGNPSATASDRPANELPLELQFVPADSAGFLYVDAATIWGHPIIKSIRAADRRFTDHIISQGRDAFGLTPDDLKTVVVFVPNLKDPRQLEKFGVVVTFKKAFDKDKLRQGIEKLLGKKGDAEVHPVNDRTALVLVNLADVYAKPQPADMHGPLTAALREAATGKHPIVGGTTIDNLPDQLRGNDPPAPFRPFQPLFKATSLTATVDLGKTIDLEVTIKTGTAGLAADCEKSLGAFVGLVQNALTDGLKELNVDKDPSLADLAALMKAGLASAKNAKFTTLGNETRLSVSIPADLPFAAAYLAAKQKTMAAAASQNSANNLKQIALAMHNYADDKGSMPPAAVCDKTGKPLLSWRVLILPYIEQNELYKEFKLDEPWDSEHNKKLLAKMPRTYAIPGKNPPGGTSTHYRVFVGNGAGFDWINGARFPAAFSDGTSNTLMCVTAESAVPWTKPDELEFDPDKDMTRLVGLVVNGRMQFAMFDGSVRTVGKIPPKATLNALITRAGGEVIDFDFNP